MFLLCPFKYLPGADLAFAFTNIGFVTLKSNSSFGRAVRCIVLYAVCVLLAGGR